MRTRALKAGIHVADPRRDARVTSRSLFSYENKHRNFSFSFSNSSLSLSLKILYSFVHKMVLCVTDLSPLLPKISLIRLYFQRKIYPDASRNNFYAINWMEIRERASPHSTRISLFVISFTRKFNVISREFNFFNGGSKFEDEKRKKKKGTYV